MKFPTTDQLRGLTRQISKKVSSSAIFQMSASLAFSTLIALVPIFTLSLSILTRLDFFRNIQNNVKTTLFELFIPAQATVIMQYVERFSENLSKLNTISIVGFLFSGVFLMINLEDSLNRVFQAPNRKGLIVKVLNYWAVLTLGPILIGSSFYLSSRYLHAAAGAAHPFIQSILPFFSSLALNTTLIFMMFHFMPNVRLKWKISATAALITGLLFEILKGGLSIYLKSLNYEKIYGSLAALPLFLIWLYLAWLILLFGAHLSSILQKPIHPESDQLKLPDWALRLDIMEKTLHAFMKDTPIAFETLQAIYPAEIRAFLPSILEEMIEEGWVIRHETLGIIPAHPPSTFESPDFYFKWLGFQAFPEELKSSEWFGRLSRSVQTLFCDHSS